MQSHVVEHWTISKPTVKGNGGMVASQHHLASEAGAEILRAGGNAIDAAIATGLALGTVEPWMSGIGGGGYMTIYLKRQDTVKVVEFGMRAPFQASAADFTLAPGGENAADAFNWPKVEGDANVHGPLSIAVPGYIKGTSLALDRFGTLPFRDVIEPACKLAEWGLPNDWYSVQKINHFARALTRYEETRKTYLGDGLPPAIDLEGEIHPIRLGRLGQTYRYLQAHGPGAYYDGPLATQIVDDLEHAGAKISLRDLAEYEARISEPLTTNYRDATVYVAGNLTAGPSLVQALQILETKVGEKVGSSDTRPGVEAFTAYAESLLETYAYRLAHLGEGPEAPTNTSHICVTDKDGNMVSLTQTIMSAFGSRIMLPQTGILMNNGMMWFDPRPGGPNSVLGGRHPLCNMCPVIVKEANSMFAAGACGGRKIFPAIFQLVSFIVDYGMNVNDALHHARIDNSGTDLITIMDHMHEDVIAALAEAFPETRLRPNGVSPNHFALPQMVRRDAKGGVEGGCFIPSPHARAIAVA
jgi:gamma-glutamyltranspeptidase/glutathione hydrolase